MNENSNIKLSMIILLVSDLEKAKEFYKKIGCSQKFALKNHWAEMAIGEIKIGLCPTSTTTENFRTGIVLETSNLQETYEKWNKLGVEFLNEPKTALHGIMASFKDSSGNIIDIYQPTPEKVLAMAEKIKENDECCKQAETCCKS